MSKKTISNKVLEKIKKEHLKPKPKWEFLLKNYVFWSAFAMAIIIGGLVASMVIFKIINNDWDIARRLGHHPVAFGFKTMPFFWIIIFAAFVFIAHYNFKHTKRGYRFKLPLTIVASLLISVLLGFSFLGMGVAKKMDEKAQKHLPFLEGTRFEQRMDMWSQIDKGVIAGEIIEIEDGFIEIENLEGETWNINTKDVSKKDLQDIEEGMIVGIIGEKGDDGNFNAEKIRPWKGNFMQMEKMHEKMHGEANGEIPPPPGDMRMMGR